MGSLLVNPKPWVPYLNNRDCSQGFCSLYCPQWCYIIFPPPPPIEFPTEPPSPNFSPLIIAIIAILASAFLLVSYYAIISKFFNGDSSRTNENIDASEGLEGNEDPSRLEPWHVANNGLEESLIKSIKIFKYERGRGVIIGTDCSVCLSEFEEDSNVKLLPKCNHAFHVFCIDTWLKSHSNCPLCRTNIFSINPLPPPDIDYVSENAQDHVIIEDIEMGIVGGDENLQNVKDENEENKDIVIEVRDGNFKKVRRSASMDFDCGRRLSIADVLLLNDEVGSSKGLPSVSSPVSMKRSLSSGSFSFPKRSKEPKLILPF